MGKFCSTTTRARVQRKALEEGGRAVVHARGRARSLSTGGAVFVFSFFRDSTTRGVRRETLAVGGGDEGRVDVEEAEVVEELVRREGERVAHAADGRAHPRPRSQVRVPAGPPTTRTRIQGFANLHSSTSQSRVSSLADFVSRSICVLKEPRDRAVSRLSSRNRHILAPRETRLQHTLPNPT